MIAPADPLRFLTLAGALLLTAAAWPQASAPTTAGSAAGTPTLDTLRTDDARQRLRAQLADPQQRQRIMAERVRQQRAINPDLARVLHLDATGVNSLLTLLAEQQLAGDLRDGPFGMGNGNFAGLFAREAAIYDQELRAITRIIGTAQLDTYVDYERTRGLRSNVQAFNAALPRELKLNNQQQDALLPLLEAREEERIQRARSRFMAPADAALRSGSQDVQTRARARLSIIQTERTLRDLEISNSTLAKRLPQVLTAEQSRRFLQSELQSLDIMSGQAQQLRREAGIGAQEQLEPVGASDPRGLEANARLEVTVRINDTEITKAAISTRGGLVSFGTVAVLSLEALPFQIGPDQVVVDLRFYESVNGTRRLVGSNIDSPQITNPRRAGALAGGVGSATVMRGRKAYVVESMVTLTYL